MTVTTRTNRQTGTRIAVGTAEALGFVGGWTTSPWYTLCEPHGRYRGFDFKHHAVRGAARPRDWCEDCKDMPSRTGDLCPSCLATRSEIAIRGHRTLDGRGRPVVPDTMTSTPCPEACSCEPQCFDRSTHRTRHAFNVPGTDIRRPFLVLEGVDGNAVIIMVTVARLLKRAGVPQGVITDYYARSRAADYDNVLSLAMRYTTDDDRS